jgi:hypothetical protein
MHYSRLCRATLAPCFAARRRGIAIVQRDAYHRCMNPMRMQTHCDWIAMKTVAVASTLVLAAVTLASAAWAQAHSRPHEVNVAVPPTFHSGGRGQVIAVTPFVQPVLVARRFCNDAPIAPQRGPLAAAAWDSAAHANAGWLVTTQIREDRGRGGQTQVQTAPAGQVTPPPHPRPAHQPTPAPGSAYDGRVDCESAYPQFDSGLVLDVLIGYGARHGVPRHDGRGGRLP